MNQERLMKVILAPIISEKSNNLSENRGQIVLKVLSGATKHEIKAAVELLFETEVESVKTLNVKGKVKRFGRYIGKRKDYKKAYVNLVAGQNLDLEAEATKTVE